MRDNAIPRGVDVSDVRLHLPIHLDRTAGAGRYPCLQGERRLRTHADNDQHHVGAPDLVVCASDGETAVALDDLRHADAGRDTNVVALELLTNEHSELGVDRRENLRQLLDHRHVEVARA